jgi:putative pyridoxal-dependent aspartate 1-decarboxylase
VSATVPSHFQSPAALFEAQVERTPERTAVSCGLYDISFRELNEKANRLAHQLVQHGIGPERLVAIYLERSVELIITLLAIAKAGGAYVPLETDLPPERLDTILEDCRPALLVTRGAPRHDFGYRCPALIDLDADWPVIERRPAHNPGVAVDHQTLLYVIYTTGMTGHPKAVQGVCRGVVNRLHWTWKQYPFQDNEVACQRVSIGFVDHVAEILAPLLAGIRLVILPGRQANDPAELVLALARKGISRLVVAPSLLRALLGVRKDALFHLPQLKYVFCSGEPLSTALAGLFYQRFKHARLINVYGATETSADATWYEVRRSDVDNVLGYFNRSVGTGAVGTRAATAGDDGPGAPGDITVANVPVEALAMRFRDTRMAELPRPLSNYLNWLRETVLPFSIDTASPRYIGHMTSALPDFVHDLSKLISELNQNLVKVETAKSAILLEREALAMLHRCFYGFSDDFYDAHVQRKNANLGLVTTGGTLSNITALMIARNRALARLAGEHEWSQQSIYATLQQSGYRDLVLLGSELMHYSMKKAASVLGLGMRNLVHVRSAPDGALDTGDLQRKLAQCRQEGLLPFAIIGIAGATETGHIDPLAQMADIAEANGIDFHVDAAWGGSGLFSAKHRGRFSGIERASSVTFCAHKQLYLPQGISVCLFRDPDALGYGATTAAYQATPDSYDVGRFSIEGSRSAMALLVHAALQVIGRRGYEALFNASMDKAGFFADIVKAMECFELLFEPPLNIVNYRYIPDAYRSRLRAGTLSAADNDAINTVNRRMQELQFERGSSFVSKTTLTNTRYGPDCPIVVFRVVLANPLTTQSDIHQVLEDQLAIAQDICGDLPVPTPVSADAGAGPTLADAFSEAAVLKESLGEPLIPIGKPLPDCVVHILDERQQPVAPGDVGELYVGGVAVARGYLHPPRDGSDRFMADPFSADPGAKLFRTGDRGRLLADGNIEYRGRNDDLVKIEGFPVELSELESALSEIEPVKHCAVTVRNDQRGARFLVAHVELDGGHCTPDDQRHALATIEAEARAKLPPQMVPRELRVVAEMPLTLSGKIDRKQLD